MSEGRKAPWLGKEANQQAWYIYWYETSKRIRRRSTRTRNRSEAERKLAEFILEYAERETNEPISKPHDYPIATALRWYLEERGPDIIVIDKVIFAVENLIEFFGSETTVSCITPQAIKRYERERKRRDRVQKTKAGTITIKDDRPLASSSIRRELAVLVAALNHAVENGRLTSAPKVPLPPAGENRTRYLEPEEIKCLLRSCPTPHVRLFIKIGITTGARKGAILDLTWEQVDLKKKMIYLNPPGRKQTKKRRAIVPINDQLYNDLVQTKKKQEEQAQKQADKTGKYMPSCAYVIAYRLKKIGDVKTGFRNSCKRAGIKGASPHTLRHTAGTLMALGGVDLFLIARLLGHSVQKTTELYAHLQPSYLRGAVNVLENATYDGQLTRVKHDGQSAAVH